MSDEKKHSLHKALTVLFERYFGDATIEAQKYRPSGKDGYYITKDENGKLDIELFHRGGWWSWGCELYSSVPSGEIVAGPFSAEQILKSVSQ